MNSKPAIFKLFIFLVCLGVTTLSCAGDKNKTSQFFNQGLKALEQGHYEDGINNLEKALIYAPNNKNIISALSLGYNNYGIILSRQPEQIDKAIFNLEKAVQLSPSDTKYRHNLSDLYCRKALKFYEQEKDYNQATKLSNKALEYNADNFLALEILGDCYYFTQELNSALNYWQKAQVLNPESKKLKERVEKVKREMRIESNLARSAADYFEIRLSKKDLPFDASLIRDYLRQVYRELGQNFNYFPKHTVVVLIYSEEEFKKYYPTPYWIGGAYDGKIHLPATTKEFTPYQFKSLIWHEYTHVLVRDLTNNNCPLWLNEGLAVWQASRYSPMDLAELKNALKNGTVIPLVELHEKFAPVNQQGKIYLAYQEAYTLLSFLIERYGFWHIQNVLARIKDQEDMGNILKSVFGLDWVSLEKRWQEYLKSFLSGDK